MLPLEATKLGQLAVYGVIWLATTVAWVVACIWVERDARETFGRSLPWRSLLTAVGAALFLGTCQFGASFVPFCVGLVVCSVATYVVVRDALVAPDLRLVPFIAVSEAVSRALRKSGLEARVQQLLGREGVAALVPFGGPAVTVLAHDGRVYAAESQPGGDREHARALVAAQGILGDAVAKRATEMHLESKTGQEVQVRYRIDGMMQAMHVLPGEAGRAIVAAIKELAGMDGAEKRRPQDGSFAVIAEGVRLDVRATSGPSTIGDKLGLWLLDTQGRILKGGLAGLGMRDSLVQTLRGIIHQGRGMLIVCGPPGSGKTTTAYAALGEIDVLTRGIVTIEDPIAYRLDNVSQTAVDIAAHLTFTKILRESLRQNPDVILVGELRDKETAEIAMQATLTGHFVCTTMQAADTATAITRLLEIGIDAALLQSSVTAVLAQRLVRLLCPKCKEAYQPSPELLRRLGLPADKVPVLYKEVGCRACHGSGFRGRTGVYELLVCDADIRSLLGGSPSVDAIRRTARRNGMRTIGQSALVKACEGVTSIGEAERVTR